MPKKYQHLTVEERDRIAVMVSEGQSLRKIAKELGRSHTSLSRELRRNVPPIYTGYYLSHKAHERAVKRNQDSHRRPRLKNASIRDYVIQKLSSGWSPELIAGRVKTEVLAASISHEAIYQWIYEEAKELIPLLTRRHRKRQLKGHRKTHKSLHIPNRTPISERPKEVEKRKVAGHWEADTVISRQSKSALLVSVERKTRFSKLSKLNRKGAREVRVSLNQTLSRFPKNLRKTLTFDNGSENVEHEKVNQALGTASYFCTPYHSWEKGTVENTIGLIRRFLPKKTDFDKVSKKDIKFIENWLNTRPKKVLNFKTPAEALSAEWCTC